VVVAVLVVVVVVVVVSVCGDSLLCCLLPAYPVLCLVPLVCSNLRAAAALQPQLCSRLPV
jgi:hypothetical protein